MDFSHWTVWSYLSRSPVRPRCSTPWQKLCLISGHTPSYWWKRDAGYGYTSIPGLLSASRGSGIWKVTGIPCQTLSALPWKRPSKQLSCRLTCSVPDEQPGCYDTSPQIIISATPLADPSAARNEPACRSTHSWRNGVGTHPQCDAAFWWYAKKRRGNNDDTVLEADDSHRARSVNGNKWPLIQRPTKPFWSP